MSGELWRPRGYSPVEGRQQRVDRLVSSESDLRRVLNDVVRGQAIGTIRLAGNIVLSRPILVPELDWGVVIDGGNRFKIRTSTSFTGSSLLVFVSGAASEVSSLLFRGITFVGPSTKLERLIEVEVARVADVSFESCRLSFIKRIAQKDSGTPTWTRSSFENLTFDNLALADVSDIGSCVYEQCLFLRCFAVVGSPSTTREVSISDQSGSVDVVSIAAGAPTSTSAVYLTDFATSQLFTLEVTRELTVGRTITATPDTVALNSAGPTLTVTRTFMRFTLGASVSGNIVLSDGAADGQLLILFCAGFTAAATLPDSTASNVRLSAAWVPDVRDTLTLVWDAGDGNWIELARSAN